MSNVVPFFCFLVTEWCELLAFVTCVACRFLCHAANSVTRNFREVNKRTSFSLSNAHHCSERKSLLFRFILLYYFQFFA